MKDWIQHLVVIVGVIILCLGIIALFGNLTTAGSSGDLLDDFEDGDEVPEMSEWGNWTNSNFELVSTNDTSNGNLTIDGSYSGSTWESGSNSGHVISHSSSAPYTSFHLKFVNWRGAELDWRIRNAAGENIMRLWIGGGGDIGVTNDTGKYRFDEAIRPYSNRKMVDERTWIYTLDVMNIDYGQNTYDLYINGHPIKKNISFITGGDAIGSMRPSIYTDTSFNDIGTGEDRMVFDNVQFNRSTKLAGDGFGQSAVRADYESGEATHKTDGSVIGVIGSDSGNGIGIASGSAAIDGSYSLNVSGKTVSDSGAQAKYESRVPPMNYSRLKADIKLDSGPDGTQTYAGQFAADFSGANKGVFGVYFQEDGDIETLSSNTNTLSKSWSGGELLNVTISDIDYSNDTYDLWINGTNYGNGLEFRSSRESVNNIGFESRDGVNMTVDNVEFGIASGSSVNVQVDNQNGNPIENANVTVNSTSDFNLTNANGKASFSLSDGDYTLTAQGVDCRADASETVTVSGSDEDATITMPLLDECKEHDSDSDLGVLVDEDEYFQTFELQIESFGPLKLVGEEVVLPSSAEGYTLEAEYQVGPKGNAGFAFWVGPESDFISLETEDTGEFDTDGQVDLVLREEVYALTAQSDRGFYNRWTGFRGDVNKSDDLVVLEQDGLSEVVQCENAIGRIPKCAENQPTVSPEGSQTPPPTVTPPTPEPNQTVQGLPTRTPADQTPLPTRTFADSDGPAVFLDTEIIESPVSNCNAIQITYYDPAGETTEIEYDFTALGNRYNSSITFDEPISYYQDTIDENVSESGECQLPDDAADLPGDGVFDGGGPPAVDVGVEKGGEKFTGAVPLGEGGDRFEFETGGERFGGDGAGSGVGGPLLGGGGGGGGSPLTNPVVLAGGGVAAYYFRDQLTTLADDAVKEVTKRI